MARCRIQNCKVKLNKDNLHTILGYCEEEINSGDPSKIERPVKIKLCRDCAKMYIGKYYNDASDKFYTFVDKIEFREEFEQDLFYKLK